MAPRRTSRGQLCQINYSRRYHLVTKGLASWIPIHIHTVEEAIKAAGL